jgi:hypothetical protein
MQKLTVEQLGLVIGGLDTVGPEFEEAGLDEADKDMNSVAAETAHTDELGEDKAATGEL